MIYQEQLRDLTEAYLKSLVAEASDSLTGDFDSSAPFGELGINSFYVLKIIKKLEVDFGTLSKSLLFEKFTIDDLAEYFVAQHEPALSRKFARQLQEVHPQEDEWQVLSLINGGTSLSEISERIRSTHALVARKIFCYQRLGFLDYWPSYIFQNQN